MEKLLRISQVYPGSAKWDCHRVQWNWATATQGFLNVECLKSQEIEHRMFSTRYFCIPTFPELNDPMEVHLMSVTATHL